MEEYIIKFIISPCSSFAGSGNILFCSFEGVIMVEIPLKTLFYLFILMIMMHSPTWWASGRLMRGPLEGWCRGAQTGKGTFFGIMIIRTIKIELLNWILYQFAWCIFKHEIVEEGRFTSQCLIRFFFCFCYVIKNPRFGNFVDLYSWANV